MFIYNIKLNGSKTFKFIFLVMILILIIILSAVTIRIFTGAKNSTCTPKGSVSKITASNYTNILKVVHEDINSYIGCKINFSGYVYRVLDLQDNQFVLARDMVISSDFQSVIVGFLCEFDNAKDFSDNTWIEITGTLIKGVYHGDMPIVRVTEIKKIDKPNDEFVYPPDESYIPTAGIL